MLHHTVVKTPRLSGMTCDSCGTRQDGAASVQDALSFRDTGGPGAPWGDGVTVGADLCSACVAKILGPYLKVDPDSVNHRPFYTTQDAVAMMPSNPPTYPVRQFLDLSTGALSVKSRAWIEENLGNMSGASTEHGWLIHVPDIDPDDAPDHDVDTPRDVALCMTAARQRHCDYILFDQDAETDFAALGLEDHSDE